MELKTARLTLLIDPAKKEAFERLCSAQDLTPSQVVRQLIRAYLTQHGVRYVPSGKRAMPAPVAAPARSRPAAKAPSRAAKSGKPGR
jgi:Ribbon-helix-helix protein